MTAIGPVTWPLDRKNYTFFEKTTLTLHFLSFIIKYLTLYYTLRKSPKYLTTLTKLQVHYTFI